VGWRGVRRGRVIVYYLPEDSARVAPVLRLLSEPGPLPALPAGVPDSVQIHLAPTRAILDSLSGGRVPEWGAAVAVPSRSRIVLPTFSAPGPGGWPDARVLRHEWAHIGLHQQLEGLRVPRWFDEGYAEWASGGWNDGEGWRLRVALALGRGPDFDSLTLGWPRDRYGAELAYMLAGTAVEYLVSASGERGLEVLLQRWPEVGSFSAALRSVYGVTPGQFEEDWKEYVRRRYGWLFVLSHSFVFWLFLGLVLLGMAWIRRRRDRRAMARLRAAELRATGDEGWWDAAS